MGSSGNNLPISQVVISISARHRTGFTVLKEADRVNISWDFRFFSDCYNFPMAEIDGWWRRLRHRPAPAPRTLLETEDYRLQMRPSQGTKSFPDAANKSKVVGSAESYSVAR